MKVKNAIRLRSILIPGAILIALAIVLTGCNTATTTDEDTPEETSQENSEDTEGSVAKDDGLGEECSKLSPPRVEGAKDAERKLAVIQT